MRKGQTTDASLHFVLLNGIFFNSISTFFLLQDNTKTMKANNKQPVRKSIIWTFPIFSFHESTNVN